MPERINMIDHNGKEILHLDFSNCTVSEVLAIVEDAKRLISKLPAGSVLTLTDVTNTHFDENVSRAMKDFVAHNKPFVKASAVVGITGLKKIIFEAVMAFSKRKLSPFQNIEDAKDWLSKQ